MSIAVLLFAGLLLSVDLGSRGLWGKEAASWAEARQSLRTLLDLGSDGGTGGPLYAAVLKGWLSLFGDSEAAIRSLSVVLTVATAAVVSALGFHLRSRSVGVLAAGLFVFNGPVQKYGQNGSAAMLLTFGASLASLALVRELQRTSPHARRWWTGLRISLSTLLVLVHPLGVVVAICHFLATLVLPAAQRRWPSRVRTLTSPSEQACRHGSPRCEVTPRLGS